MLLIHAYAVVLLMTLVAAGAADTQNLFSVRFRPFAMSHDEPTWEDRHQQLRWGVINVLNIRPQNNFDVNMTLSPTTCAYRQCNAHASFSLTDTAGPSRVEQLVANLSVADHNKVLQALEVDEFVVGPLPAEGASGLSGEALLALSIIGVSLVVIALGGGAYLYLRQQRSKAKENERIVAAEYYNEDVERGNVYQIASSDGELRA